MECLFDAHDAMNGKDTVVIIMLFILLHLHLTTTIGSYRDIRLSLWFQYDLFGHSDLVLDCSFK